MLSTEDGPKWLRSVTNVRAWMVSPVILGFFYQIGIKCELVITFIKHFRRAFFHILSHLIFKVSIYNTHLHPHFTDAETEPTGDVLKIRSTVREEPIPKPDICLQIACYVTPHGLPCQREH